MRPTQLFQLVGRHRSKVDVVREAAIEVRKPTMFGELIIMIVYLPILTLEGIEGKMFRPMALTVIFALLGSMILSLTLMPVLASLILPKKIEEKEPLMMRIAHAIHNPILRLCMHHKFFVVGFALIQRGRSQLTAANLAPTRTIESLKDDAEWVKDQTR